MQSSDSMAIEMNKNALGFERENDTDMTTSADGAKGLTLDTALLNVEYEITAIETSDDELNSFLFTLGCYVGEKITVISKLKNNFVVAIKDARYSIDSNLADVIAIR